MTDAHLHEALEKIRDYRVLTFVHDERQKIIDALRPYLVPQWQPIETAPRDGTVIDLFYPYPRGRTINCYWDEGLRGWVWRRPTWRGSALLPESEWHFGAYPGLEPTHWMPLPKPPQEPAR